MKTSLDHLPEHKKRELNTIVEMIRKASPKVEMILLFGSYARGDWREEKDIPADAKSGTASDYDILIIVADEQACQEKAILGLEREILWSRFSTYARLLIHDIDFINEKLRLGQYFFKEIIDQGILLYDSKKIKLNLKSTLTPKQIYQKAEHYFEKSWKNAKSFWETHFFNLKMKELNHAAFHMHQTSETLLKAFLLVYTDYSPKGHFLSDLIKMASKHKEEMSQVFPYSTKQEKKLFDRLDYSYIGGRYDLNFQMKKEELSILQPYVEKLFVLTKKLCEERLEKLRVKWVK